MTGVIGVARKAKENPSEQLYFNLAASDSYQLKRYCHAKGKSVSEVVRSFTEAELRAMSRCREIDKAEEEATMQNPKFVPYAQSAREGDAEAVDVDANTILDEAISLIEQGKTAAAIAVLRSAKS